MKKILTLFILLVAGTILTETMAASGPVQSQMYYAVTPTGTITPGAGQSGFQPYGGDVINQQAWNTYLIQAYGVNYQGTPITATPTFPAGTNTPTPLPTATPIPVSGTQWLYNPITVTTGQVPITISWPTRFNGNVPRSLCVGISSVNASAAVTTSIWFAMPNATSANQFGGCELMVGVTITASNTASAMAEFCQPSNGVAASFWPGAADPFPDFGTVVENMASASTVVFTPQGAN